MQAGKRDCWGWLSGGGGWRAIAAGGVRAIAIGSDLVEGKAMQDMHGSSQIIRQELICQAKENGFICGSAYERGSTSYLPEIDWSAADLGFNW